MKKRKGTKKDGQTNIYTGDMSYSNERHEFCKSLKYDVFDLGELHQVHATQHNSRMILKVRGD